MFKATSIEDSFDYDSTVGSNLDQEEVFEEFIEVDMDAFIDAQFEDVFKEEGIMYPGNEEGMKAIPLEAQLGAARSCLFTENFTFQRNSLMFDIDSKLAVPLDQGQLICSQCNKTLNEGEAQSSRRGTDSIGANDRQTNEKVLDQAEMVVTEEQLCDISDDVGTCWRQLGPKLKIKASKIHNIDEEYRSNRDKANALLIIWKEQEGSNATVGCLAASLQSIGRKSIADKLLGVNNMKLPTCVTTCEEHMINLSVKCDLDADLVDKLMLCEDGHGRKYILKEIGADGGPWNVEEIQKNKRFLESIAVAAHEMVKTAEQRRQESLKRISSEVQELRHKLKRVKLDCRVLDSRDGAARVPNGEQSAESPVDGIKGLQDELETRLKSCECQRESWQAMFAALIKLVGEAGQPKEDNCKCLKQLFDFTKELHDQEKKLFPIIEQLQKQKQQLDKPQCTRLEELKKWQRTNTQQLDGLERLLSSLLDQGRIKETKLMNRRSEPLLSKKLSSSNGFGRRRTKTDSSKSSSKSFSLSELQDANTKDIISEPLCVRRMCLVETSKNLTTRKAED